MPVRAPWMDRYAIEQTATLTANPTFASTAIGIEGTGSDGGVFLAPTTDHPHLKPSTATQENELAVGLSQRHHLEYNQTVAEPNSITLNMLANSYNVSLFMWLLFQEAAGEGTVGSNTVMSVAPYTTADIEQYAAITRFMGGTAGDDDTVSQYMTGAICRSMTISGEVGGIMMVSAEMIGASWNVANDDLGSTSWSALTFSNKAPLKFQDMVMSMDGNVVDVPSFSITISNNAVAQFYNNGTIQRYVLGRLTVEGEFGIPWGDAAEGGNATINDFIAGTDKLIQVYWSDADGSEDNSLSIKSNVRYTDSEITDSEGEITTNTPFAGVYDGTYNALEMYAGYATASLVRGTPAATTTSTSTTSTSTS